MSFLWLILLAALTGLGGIGGGTSGGLSGIFNSILGLLTPGTSA